MKRRTEITIEIDRVTVISSEGHQQNWCEACSANVEMVALDEAVKIAGTTMQALSRMARAGAIHVRQAADGMPLICLDSLLRREKPEQSIETSLLVAGSPDERHTG